MEGEREAGGLWCREVLAMLSDYVEGELDRASRERVEAHLLECDVCARFGGEYQGTIVAIREALGKPEPLDPRVAAGLTRRVFGDD